MIYTFDLSRADDVIAITVNVHAASIEGALDTLVSQTRSGGLVARCAPVGTEDGVVEIALSMAGYGRNTCVGVSLPGIVVLRGGQRSSTQAAGPPRGAG
jgi:hypothetical protein